MIKVGGEGVVTGVCIGRGGEGSLPNLKFTIF